MAAGDPQSPYDLGPNYGPQGPYTPQVPSGVVGATSFLELLRQKKLQEMADAAEQAKLAQTQAATAQANAQTGYLGSEAAAKTAATARAAQHDKDFNDAAKRVINMSPDDPQRQNAIIDLYRIAGDNAGLTAALKPEPDFTLGPGDQRFHPAGGAPIASVPVKPPAGAQPAPFASMVNGKLQWTERDPATNELRVVSKTADGQPLAPPPTAAVVSLANPPVKLTNAALDQAAQTYLDTGKLPALGMGSAGGSRQEIMNRAAELGGGQRLAANSATYDANKASLTNVQKTLDTLTAFENTASKNLDMATGLASKIPDWGAPWLNAPIRAVNRRALGSDDQAAFDTALAVANREIARVTNDPKLSGALTDSARAEVQALNPSTMTARQIFRVASVLKQDMENVRSGLTTQRDDIQRRLGGGGQAARAVPGASTGGSTITRDEVQNGVTYSVTRDSAGNFISAVKKGG